MKKHEISFSVIKIPLDFLWVFISFFLAKHIREITDFLPGIHLPPQTISDESLQFFALFGACIYILVFALHGMYTIKISHSKVKEFLDIILYSLYFFTFFSLLVYLSNGLLYTEAIPRLIIAFATLISIFGISVQRTILNQIQALLIHKGVIKKRSLLLVTNKKDDSNKNILTDIQKARIYDVIGYINNSQVKGNSGKYLGGIDDFLNISHSGVLDEILIIDSDFSKEELYRIWDESRIHGVRYRYLTNYFDISAGHTSLTLINSIPVIEIKNTSLENWGRVWKRLLDIVLSISALIISLPLIIVTATIIKIEDPSAPVIFKNKRVGIRGKYFYLYKFRYLKWKYCTHEGNTEALAFEKKLIQERSDRKGPLYKIKNDPRKSRVGQFIEKYSIDELPQLFNVLIGNMSLVGPRPHQPREVNKYEIYQRRVLTIKPGITGMSQINGRDKNTFDKEVKLDIFYIENWSFLLDCKILLKTLPIIFQRK